MRNTRGADPARKDPLSRCGCDGAPFARFRNGPEPGPPFPPMRPSSACTHSGPGIVPPKPSPRPLRRVRGSRSHSLPPAHVPPRNDRRHRRATRHDHSPATSATPPYVLPCHAVTVSLDKQASEIIQFSGKAAVSPMCRSGVTCHRPPEATDEPEGVGSHSPVRASVIRPRLTDPATRHATAPRGSKPAIRTVA